MSDDELLAQVPSKAAPAPAPAATPAPPAEDQTVFGELGRQVGLTARAAVKGALALPGMVSDAVTGPINAGLDAVAGEGVGPRFQKVSSAADNLLTGAGLPEPRNATERVVQDIAGGLTGTGATIAAGNALAKAAGPVTAAVGELLAAAPATQLASTAAGTGAAGITRESGGGQVAQTVAGLAGALAPTTVPFAAQAGAKATLRGGEAGRGRVAENIKTFEEAAGTTPTMGQATQSRTLQAAETGLSNVVGSSGVMIRRGEAQSKALQDSVQELTDALAPNATGADAGAAITRGVNAFKDNVKTVQQRLYGELDRHITEDAPISVERTRGALRALNEGIEGAPALSEWFKNARIKGIEGALQKDTEGTAAVLTRPGMAEKAKAFRAPLEEDARLIAQANANRAADFRKTLEEQSTRAEISNADRLAQLRSSLDSEAAEATAANQALSQRAEQIRTELTELATQTATANAERRMLGMNNLEPEMSAKEIAQQVKDYIAANTRQIMTPAQIEKRLAEFKRTEFEPVLSRGQIDKWAGSFAKSDARPVPSKTDIDTKVDEFLQSQVTGQMPYESIKKLRTLVGKEVAENSLVADVPRSKWRALYAALSEDLGDAARQSGPAAEQAWNRANQFTRGSMNRLEQLETIVNRDAPEKVFKAATTGLAEGGTTINRLMKSLPVENRREVAAAVLQRLGRAKPGAQNEMGDAFSSETFLTNLATMSPAARRALFGSSGFPGLEQRINQMGRMASVRREGSQVFANPSGTARQAGMIAWAGALAGALATGNAAAIVGALAAPVATNVAARLATNPERVRALARRTELSAAAGPSAAAAAARIPNGEPADGQRFRRRIEAERAARRPAQ